MAFRYFLQVDLYHQLVDPSALAYFRARLGVDGFRRVFDQTTALARSEGLVKERLRLKDATHVLANIDVPCTLALVSQTRDKLLAAAEPFQTMRVEGERTDILLDPDSELITQINVLATNAEEAEDAIVLIRQEEAAHDNDIEGLSIDGAGWDGKVLRELQDPDDLAVEVTVPPKKEAETELFTPADFVEDAEAGTVTCPGGETSSYRQRNKRDTGTMYRFKAATCAACPLVSQCLGRRRAKLVKFWDNRFTKASAPDSKTDTNRIPKNDSQSSKAKTRDDSFSAASAGVCVSRSARRLGLAVKRR